MFGAGGEDAALVAVGDVVAFDALFHVVGRVRVAAIHVADLFVVAVLVAGQVLAHCRADNRAGEGRTFTAIADFMPQHTTHDAAGQGRTVATPGIHRRVRTSSV